MVSETENTPHVLSWEACMALIDQLPAMPLEEREKTLEALVRNPSPGIRQRVIQMGGAVLTDEHLTEYLRNPTDDVLRNAGLEILKRSGERGRDLAIKLLKDDDADVVIQAALILDYMKDPSSVQPLKDALRHANLNVLQAVIVALGHIGEPSSIPDLLPFLLGDPWLQIAAITSLGNIGSPEALPHLTKMLKDPFLGPFAAEAISHIGGPTAYKSVAKHWLKMNDKDQSLVILRFLTETIERLNKIPAAIPGLKEALKQTMELEDDSERSMLAARSLLSTGPSENDFAALQKLSDLSAESLPRCLTLRQDLAPSLLQMDDPYVSWGIYLAASAPKNLPVEPLRQVFSNADKPVPEHWISALSSLKSEAAAGLLVDLFVSTPPENRDLLMPLLRNNRNFIRKMDLTHYDSPVQIAIGSASGDSPAGVAKRIVALDEESRLNVIQQILQFPDVLKKIPWKKFLEENPDAYAPLAAHAAINTGNKDLIQPLRRFLKIQWDPDVVRALGALKDDEAIPLLIQKTDQGDQLTKALVIDTLGQIGSERARKALETFLRDDAGFPEKKLIYRALSHCATAEDSHLFEEAAKHSDWLVRLSAVEFFTRIDVPQKQEIISRLAADPAPLVAQKAKAAQAVKE